MTDVEKTRAAPSPLWRTPVDKLTDHGTANPARDKRRSSGSSWGECGLARLLGESLSEGDYITREGILRERKSNTSPPPPCISERGEELEPALS